MESTPPVALAFMRLLTIMDELREQCPWDRKQTEQTLRPLTIEETYELADAITKQDWNGIREELGDLMLHLVFYARIARELERFTLEEVIHGICDKLVSRHPHVYGDVQVKDEEEVKKNWEKLKIKEGKKSVLGGVPVSLPALVKAIRIQEKAKQVGFEWENREDVVKKVEEETGELKEALHAGDSTAIEEEFGDLLFRRESLKCALTPSVNPLRGLCDTSFISGFIKKTLLLIRADREKVLQFLKRHLRSKCLVREPRLEACESASHSAEDCSLDSSLKFGSPVLL